MQKKGSQKRFKKFTKKVHFKGIVTKNLTKTEQEILRLLTSEFLTIKQIAKRRQTSTRTIYKHIQNLKEKGILSGKIKKAKISGCGQALCEPNSIRLHGQEFNIKIISKSNEYRLQQGKVIFLDGNTIKCYRNSIEIYSGQSFFADDEFKATSKSMEYFTRFFVKLENLLKIVILKERINNINQVNAHYSEINNEIAKETDKKIKIKIYAKEDGKLWFLIDNSWNLNELECVHPETGKDDMNTMRLFLNDLRENPTTFSRLHELLTIPVLRTEKKIDILVPVIEAFSRNVELHLDVMKNIDITLLEMREEMRISRLRRDAEDLLRQVQQLRRDTKL